MRMSELLATWACMKNLTTSGGQNQIVIRLKSRLEAYCDSIQAQKIRFDRLWLEIWFSLLLFEIWFGPKWFGYERGRSRTAVNLSSLVQNHLICNAAHVLNSQRLIKSCITASVGHQWRGQLVPHGTCQTRQSSSITTGRVPSGHPATWASVERLLSVDGTIIRARRSSHYGSAVNSRLQLSV